MSKVIAFCATDLHEGWFLHVGFLWLNFMCVHFHKDTKWATTSKLGSADWWFQWPLPMMLENTLLSFVISMARLLHLPPCLKKVKAALSSFCVHDRKGNTRKEECWVFAKRPVKISQFWYPSSVSIAIFPWPQLYRKCFGPHHPKSQTGVKLQGSSASFYLVHLFLGIFWRCRDSNSSCLPDPGR